jgi:hypothetical protein
MTEQPTAKRSSFYISPKEFLERLGSLHPKSGVRSLWVSLRSTLVSLTANTSNIQLGEQAITFLPQQLSPDHLAHNGITVWLPSEDEWDCEQRFDGEGNERLSLVFAFRWHIEDGQQKDDPLIIVVATDEGFLTLPDSESRVQ